MTPHQRSFTLPSSKKAAQENPKLNGHAVPSTYFRQNDVTMRMIEVYATIFAFISAYFTSKYHYYSRDSKKMC